MPAPHLFLEIFAPGQEEPCQRETHMPSHYDHAMETIETQSRFFNARGLTVRWTFTDADGIDTQGTARPTLFRLGSHDESTLRAVVALLRTQADAPDGFDLHTLADVIDAQITQARPDWRAYTLKSEEGTTEFSARDIEHAKEKAREICKRRTCTNPRLFMGALREVETFRR